jgi:hypothetical protein
MMNDLKCKFAQFHEDKMSPSDLKLIQDSVTFVEGELLKQKKKDAEFSKKIFGGSQSLYEEKPSIEVEPELSEYE